jgi:hypothetical protein
MQSSPPLSRFRSNFYIRPEDLMNSLFPLQAPPHGLWRDPQWIITVMAILSSVGALVLGGYSAKSRRTNHSAASIRRAAAFDLVAVIAVFLSCSAALPTLDALLRRGHGLTGILGLAVYQFSCEGLAPLVIMIARRERLSRYGFNQRNVATSVAMGFALAAINDLAMSWHVGVPVWIPLRRHSAMRMALNSGAATSVAGLAIIVAIWGFVESFFGVFFATKLNESLGRPRRGWFAAGTLGFALFNGSIHFAIGQGLEGFLTSFASGYVIAVIPAVTQSAWGSAVFQTLTNAVGRR